ncbi:hypothetical protein BDZ91DRAFT_731294 [Kalaharituber pfeilii]|nr:hypothetical protein BDZ91DRAFT_731294 [Kalaharituber pfeilii]
MLYCVQCCSGMVSLMWLGSSPFWRSMLILQASSVWLARAPDSYNNYLSPQLCLGKIEGAHSHTLGLSMRPVFGIAS